ncbi:hypothetical protein GC177_09280 [bacterium]|nr:hypothetical protein [bacterium]
MTTSTATFLADASPLPPRRPIYRLLDEAGYDFAKDKTRWLASVITAYYIETDKGSKAVKNDENGWQFTVNRTQMLYMVRRFFDEHAEYYRQGWADKPLISIAAIEEFYAGVSSAPGILNKVKNFFDAYRSIDDFFALPQPDRLHIWDMAEDSIIIHAKEPFGLGLYDEMDADRLDAAILNLPAPSRQLAGEHSKRKAFTFGGETYYEGFLQSTMLTPPLKYVLHPGVLEAIFPEEEYGSLYTSGQLEQFRTRTQELYAERGDDLTCAIVQDGHFDGVNFAQNPDGELVNLIFNDLWVCDTSDSKRLGHYDGNVLLRLSGIRQANSEEAVRA